MEACKRICLDVLEQKWEFQGKLMNYKVSTLLSTFMKWVLVGLHTMNSEDGETYQVNNINTTSQFVSQKIKILKQRDICIYIHIS